MRRTAGVAEKCSKLGRGSIFRAMSGRQAHFRPILAKFGPTRTSFGQRWPKSARVGEAMAEFSGRCPGNPPKCLQQHFWSISRAFVPASFQQPVRRRGVSRAFFEHLFSDTTQGVGVLRVAQSTRVGPLVVLCLLCCHVMPLPLQSRLTICILEWYSTVDYSGTLVAAVLHDRHTTDAPRM